MQANSLTKCGGVDVLNPVNFLGFDTPGVKRAKTAPGTLKLIHFTCKWPNGDAYKGHAEGYDVERIKQQVRQQFERDGAAIEFMPEQGPE